MLKYVVIRYAELVINKTMALDVPLLIINLFTTGMFTPNETLVGLFIMPGAVILQKFFMHKLAATGLAFIPLLDMLGPQVIIQQVTRRTGVVTCIHGADVGRYFLTEQIFIVVIVIDGYIIREGAKLHAYTILRAMLSDRNFWFINFQ